MRFEATSKPLSQILKLGQHTIPRYQRPYSWDELNVTEFYNDLRTSNHGHFLGSMVVSVNVGSNREIVDGQQRLTTTLILLSVLRDEYNKLDAPGKVCGIQTYIEDLDDDGNKRYRITNKDNGAQQRLFENVLVPEQDRFYPNGQAPDSKEVKAQNKFKELITQSIKGSEDPLEELDQIRDAVLRAEAVYIEADSRQDAFSIFETLNDRGQSLTTVDLVKNTLFSNLPEEPANQEEALWENVMKLVEDSKDTKLDPQQFLYYHWNSIAQSSQPSNDPIEEKRITRSLQSMLETEDSALKESISRSILTDMLTSAKIFHALNNTLGSNGSSHDWKVIADELDQHGKWTRQRYDAITRQLYGILVTEATQPYMLLFSLLRKYFENDWFKTKVLLEFLENVRNYQFRWSISQRSSTSTHRKIYRRAATAVSLARNIDDIRNARLEFEKGSKKAVTDKQFSSGLEKLSYTNSKSMHPFRIRYILEEIARSNVNCSLDFSTQQTIEHIEPQGSRSERSKRNAWVFKLGNLMLLPGKVNNELRNDDFESKSQVLSEYILDNDKVLQKAVETGQWNNKLARKRQGELIKLACEIWSA
ncbi:DUF262 domain-containing protein [Corynebacterium macclintockiae]|uniref:DUF262 domain-containing protein n=1 Tax=Corynebacterium macclintockiae TaxID=2913501 RepID=UPI003EBE4EE7